MYNEDSEDYQGGFQAGQNHNNGGIGIASVVALLVFLYFAGWLGKVKYEGQNAEYWFNAYDNETARYENFRDCVETYYDNPRDLYYQCL